MPLENQVLWSYKVFLDRVRELTCKHPTQIEVILRNLQDHRLVIIQVFLHKF